MAIEQFAKNSEHFFLSSMYTVPGGIEIAEGVVPAAENIYQAAKFDDSYARRIVLLAEDGYLAKKAADRLVREGFQVREDWEEVKLDAMREAVARKFAIGGRMARLLLSTGNEELIQGNTHGDTFWGVDPPGSTNGQNWLGRILMDRRLGLRQADTRNS